jgi:CheY-like chemotaxis protein
MTAPEVLIVDDDPRNCELLGRLLEMEGCRVRTASNAGSGLAMAAEIVPDLVLLDVRMPGVDGFEACRRLRVTPATAAIPIFLVTAFDDDDVWPEATAAGASGLLGKPYDRAALRRLLRELAGAAPSSQGGGAREA